MVISPKVITLPDLIRLTAADQSTDGYLTLNGRPIKSLGLVHCVGSRHIPEWSNLRKGAGSTSIVPGSAARPRSRRPWN